MLLRFQKNWSALTRLDQNRAVSEIAIRTGVLPGDVKNVIIWGNHSTTQYPDCTNATIFKNGSTPQVTAVLKKEFLENEFITLIQNRGAAVIAQRGSSSAQSASRAIVCHMRDWFLGTKPNEFVSMAVLSDGAYGVPAGLVFSFPVSISNGQYSIVSNLNVSEFGKKKFQLTIDELEQEKNTVLELLNDSKY